VSLVLSTLLLTLAYADPACQGHECPLTVNTLLQAHTTNHDSARDAGEIDGKHVGSEEAEDVDNADDKAVTEYDLVGDGWCSWGGHQASLCATNYAVGSSVRGQVAASETATCAGFDANGYANSTFDEAKKLCDEEPNCQGFTYVTDRAACGWIGDIRLSSNITTFGAANGLQCWKKAVNIKTCPTGYILHDGMEMNGYTWRPFSADLVSTAQGCADACNKISDCKSFDWVDGTACQFHDKGEPDQTTDLGTEHYFCEKAASSS